MSFWKRNRETTHEPLVVDLSEYGPDPEDADLPPIPPDERTANVLVVHRIQVDSNGTEVWQISGPGDEVWGSHDKNEVVRRVDSSPVKLKLILNYETGHLMPWPHEANMSVLDHRPPEPPDWLK